jgi:hypothetical protein
MCLRSEFCLPDRRILWIRWGLAICRGWSSAPSLSSQTLSPQPASRLVLSNLSPVRMYPQLVWPPPYQSSSDGWSSLHKRWVGLLYLNYFIYSNVPPSFFLSTHWDLNTSTISVCIKRLAGFYLSSCKKKVYFQSQRLNALPVSHFSTVSVHDYILA